GKIVKVTGYDRGSSLAVVRLVLAPEQDVQTTTTIRVNGFLSFMVLERFPALSVYRVLAGDRVYKLKFETEALRKQAEDLNGQRVVLTGTLQGQVITVAELKEDTTASVEQTVVVRGKLTWHDPHPEQPHFAIDPPLHGVWEIEAEG